MVTRGGRAKLGPGPGCLHPPHNVLSLRTLYLTSLVLPTCPLSAHPDSLPLRYKKAEGRGRVMWREWQVSLPSVSRWLQLGGPEQLPREKSRKGEFKEVRELGLERSFNNSGKKQSTSGD